MTADPIDALIAAVNARMPSSVRPSTRMVIHPSEWLLLADEVARLKRDNAVVLAQSAQLVHQSDRAIEMLLDLDADATDSRYVAIVDVLEGRSPADVPCKHERIQSLDTHPPMLSCMDCGADLSVTRG